MVQAAGAQEAEGSQRRDRAVPRTPLRAVLGLTLACALLAGCGREDAPEDRVPQGDKAVKSVKRPDGKARGVMLVFSGGSWLAPPPTAVETTRHYEERYTKQGWIAVNVGYRPGGEESFADVTQAYDKAREDNPGLPICAVGESSGGHLALMLAIERELDCVETVGAPVDLTGGLPRILQKAAAAVFGREELKRWSPLLRADEIRHRVLIVHAHNDKVVPVAQARALGRELEESELIVLPPGDLDWMHGARIDRAAYTRYLKREREWLGSLRSR